MMEGINEVMTVKEVADYLKMCPMTIYRIVNEGGIPGFKVGADWRFRREAIKEWILSREKVNGNGNGKGHKKKNGRNGKNKIKIMNVVGK